MLNYNKNSQSVYKYMLSKCNYNFKENTYIYKLYYYKNLDFILICESLYLYNIFDFIIDNNIDESKVLYVNLAK